MGLLKLYGSNVTERAVQASVVVPVDPASGRELDVDDASVGSLVEDGGAVNRPGFGAHSVMCVRPPIGGR